MSPMFKAFLGIALIAGIAITIMTLAIMALLIVWLSSSVPS